MHVRSHTKLQTIINNRSDHNISQQINSIHNSSRGSSHRGISKKNTLHNRLV